MQTESAEIMQMHRYIATPSNSVMSLRMHRVFEFSNRMCNEEHVINFEAECKNNSKDRQRPQAALVSHLLKQ